MKTILVLAAVLLFSPSSSTEDMQAAPDHGFVFGRVTDARNGEELLSVRVYIVDAKIGALTNREGLFLLQNVPLGEATVRLERLCFHPVTIKVRLTSGLSQRRIDIGLPYDHEEGCDRQMY